MAEILTFDPLSEFEILETFDFEEEIQRPENLRFFTLKDQLNDYFQKMLPKDKTVSKFEIKKLAREVDRFEEAYTSTVTVTDTDYKVDRIRKSLNVDWIKGIYEKFDYTSYSLQTDWAPLFAKESRSIPQYYNRMITALPHPFKTTGSEGVLLEEDSTLVDEDGKNTVHVLSNYKRTRTVIHDDGSIDVVLVPMANTNDDIRVKGYYLEKRENEIPNPLADHPFLSTNMPSKIITDEPLLDIFPSIQAVVTHGVPTTTDPYIEGLKYLKVYDVKLSQIPWEYWKKQFPPVDTITASPPVLSVTFPDQADDVQPSKSLQDSYVEKWSIGLASRFWLMQQEDAGLIVIKMLLSRSNEHGNVAVIPLETEPPTQFPFSTPDECYTFDTFESLINSGVYRAPTWKELSDAIDKDKPWPLGTCITHGYIEQEQKKLISHGRIVWNETFGHTILDDHVKLLKKLQKPSGKKNGEKFEKTQRRPDSEMKRHVIAILTDVERTELDKSDSIERLVTGLQLVNNNYIDKDDLFVVCSHTISILKGELNDNRLDFYEKWTGTVDGFRVCKFCGESINTDVIVAQDDFDSAGHVVINYDTLNDQVYHGDGQFANFTTSLKNIQSMLITGRTSENILYFMISLLQILPEEKQLLPILQTIRDVSEPLRKNQKIAQPAKDRIEGILGIIGVVFLLQIHNPFLYPRRSVSKLTGYPRDSDDPKKSDIISSLLSVLKTPYEQYPNLFKGAATEIFKEIINNPRKVKDEVVRYMGPFMTKFKSQLEEARKRYEETVPVEPITIKDVIFPLIHIDKTEYGINDKTSKEEMPTVCIAPGPHSYLAGLKLPAVTQDPLILQSSISQSPSSEELFGKKSDIDSVKFTDTQIRNMQKIGVPKAFSKNEKLVTFLKSKEDSIAYVTFLNRLLDLLSSTKYDIKKLKSYRNSVVYLTSDKSLTRDIVIGLIYELLDDISKNAVFVKLVTDSVKNDTVMKMIFLTSEEAEAENEALRTEERERLKKQLRSMNDTEREITKMLLDIGIAEFLITNADREFFAARYAQTKSELETAKEESVDVPEDGHNDTRDYVENGDVPIGDNGVELEVDYGDYGDRGVRDYDDYGNTGNIDDGGGFEN
jgi:hypothetical protein